jgi:hypothetical protein
MALLPEDIQESDPEAVSSQTEIAYLSRRGDVVTAEVKENVDISVEKMNELLQEAVRIAGFKKYFVIVDARAGFRSEADVRDYYADNDYSKYRYADAFIVKSLAVRLMVNFYISFNKPSIPTKTFTDPEHAMQWINELRQRLN